MKYRITDVPENDKENEGKILSLDEVQSFFGLNDFERLLIEQQSEGARAFLFRHYGFEVITGEKEKQYQDYLDGEE